MEFSVLEVVVFGMNSSRRANHDHHICIYSILNKLGAELSTAKHDQHQNDIARAPNRADRPVKQPKCL